MKKSIIFGLFIAGIALFISCRENNEEEARLIVETVTEQAVAADTLRAGYALRVNTPLMRIDGDDPGDYTARVVWLTQMDLGERVLIGETRRLTNHTGNVYYFFAVRRANGNEGWSWTTQVALGGSLAVAAVENANLYRGPGAIHVSGILLPRKTVVVYYPETENAGFVQIRGFDSVRMANILAGSYVRLSSLSMNHPDINSSILLQTALPLSTTQPQAALRREALLDAALTDHPESVFFMDILHIVRPEAALALASPPADAIAYTAPALTDTYYADGFYVYYFYYFYEDWY